MLTAMKGFYENGTVYFDEDVSVQRGKVVVLFLTSQAQNVEGKLNLEEDPILKFIGGVSRGSLAQKIDQTLYEK
ncbi:hypothetical protein FJZ31_16765 [Candidatus Poribacteria bacterium]|nr:hypothetical protein [Candidatus Poribacteria bacterium]